MSPEIPRPPAPDGGRWAGARRRAVVILATGVTEPARPRPARLRIGRLDLVFAADVVIAFICWLTTNAALVAQNSRAPFPRSPQLLLLVAFLVSAPLVLRTRFPFTAWWTSAVAMVLPSVVIPSRSLALGAYLPAGVLVYMLCLYAVAVRCRGWVVIAAGLVTVAATVVIDPRTSVAAILAAIPLLVGVVVRVRRSGREQLIVAERRHVGERALLEERQRIARELHDIVAHHMSVIAIQAEAAPYKIADPPGELVESFRDIRASALSGLGELRRLLGVLRSESSGTAPQPGLADLETLLQSARGGGVTVTGEITGTPRLLPEGVDLSAYRIVQEALSNAMRHAPGSAVRVQLSYRDSGLVIEVRNDPCPPGAGLDGGQSPAAAAAGGPGSGSGVSEPGASRLSGLGAGGGVSGLGGGHGIIGMRERAAMLGGHLSAGPAADGAFLVTAYLPLDSGQAAVPR